MGTTGTMRFEIKEASEFDQHRRMSGRSCFPYYEDIAAALKAGKAVAIEPDGVDGEKVRVKLSSAMRNRGIRISTAFSQVDGKVWLRAKGVK